MLDQTIQLSSEIFSSVAQNNLKIYTHKRTSRTVLGVKSLVSRPVISQSYYYYHDDIRFLIFRIRPRELVYQNVVFYQNFILLLFGIFLSTTSNFTSHRCIIIKNRHFILLFIKYYNINETRIYLESQYNNISSYVIS